MPFGLIDWLSSVFERTFPEREIYVRSHGSVRYLTLSPRVQAVVAIASLGLVIWAATFTIRSYLSDTEIAFRDQALIEVREAYESRVRKLQDRYVRLEAELEDSERRFDEVMRQLSGKHGQLENAAGVELALEGRLDAGRRRLTEVTEQRDDALTKLEELRFASLEMERRLAEAQRLAEQRKASLDDFVSTMDDTSKERDSARKRVRELSAEVAELNQGVEDIRRHQAQVMAQLEEATQASIVELERILKRTGVDIDSLVKEIERTYSGEGGPFIPILYRTPNVARDFPINEVSVANALDRLQRVNSLKIALDKLPLAVPLRATYRFSSGFGPRRHPVTGRWIRHNGIDMAAPKGTPIYTPIGGVVKFAGRQGGYGNVVKIRHSLGYETVYAHMSKIDVKKGDTVSRWTKVGEVGTTGRSTGNHLHYEIRRYGEPLNPRKFIEAGRYVF